MTPPGRSRLIGAANFRGWHFVLFFDGSVVQFPRRCACCGAPRTLPETASDGRRSVTYPICALCRRHARISDLAGLIAVITGLFLAVTTHLKLYGLKVPTGLGLAGLLFLIILIGGAAVFYGFFRMFIPKTKDCADRESPVIMLGATLSRSREIGKTEIQVDFALRKMRLDIEEKSPGVVTLQLTSERTVKDLFQAHGFPPEEVVRIDEAKGRVTATTVRREIRLGDQRFSSMEDLRAHLVDRYGEAEGNRVFAGIEKQAAALGGKAHPGPN